MDESQYCPLCEQSSKRIAELEASTITHDEWYALNNKYSDAADKIVELAADSAAAWDKCEERRLENDELAAQIAMLREALGDCLVNIAQGRFDQDTAEAALTATSSDWLKRHDAKVLRNAAKMFEKPSFSAWRSEVRNALNAMAAELEGEKG